MSKQSKQGLLIAAPASGSGKTVLTLALLRALKDRGVDIASAKAGPDYIDPAFHAIASGYASVNLDPWAMTPPRFSALAERQEGTHLLVEGMMGLYDGAVDGSGSAAELSKALGVPVILIVDAAKQSHSIAALVRGFRDHDEKVKLAGVILNKVGSARHKNMLVNALEAINVNVLGVIPRDESFLLPERHLGLVQAGETQDIEAFIKQAAVTLSKTCDLDAVAACFVPVKERKRQGSILPPLGQSIAIAQDEAFSFIYPHLLEDWRQQGATISFFSPLANQAPQTGVSAIYLPGGYPELYAGKLAAAEDFKFAMAIARDRETLIYGECGGYMVLGEGIVDAEGKSHAMAGLLKLETSFEQKKLHLGYRSISGEGFVLGEELNGHEFHYTSALKEEGEPLFTVKDALGEDLGNAGLRDGNIMGSYMHVIDGR